MKDRIKQIRKDADLSQTKFGERLGVTLSAVQKWEMGHNQPDASSIKLMCEKFSVNESWLRDGIGDMHGDQAKQMEMGAAVAKLMSNRPDSFKAAVVSALLRFDPDGPEWRVLEMIYDSIENEKSAGEWSSFPSAF